ncbi:MAG: hypothetical protein EZS28_013222 [Streblomastix strix]|uniref:Uncharacterized protein n=1 Tax=Streblomastix strix TaxID=222440 RepID=A0A5J4W8L0_9EUKA|nr:MAG: hypothetical protein EZS28_013222 [Streblomastix strix]
MNPTPRESKIDKSDSDDDEGEDYHGVGADYRLNDEEGQYIKDCGGQGVGSGRIDSENIKMGRDWRCQQSSDGSITQFDIKNSKKGIMTKFMIS